MIRIPSLRLDLTEEERDDLLLSLVLQNRHLAEVNSFLVCRVLSTLGLSNDEINEHQRVAHEFVWNGIERQLAEITPLGENIAKQIRDALGGQYGGSSDDEAA